MRAYVFNIETKQIHLVIDGEYFAIEAEIQKQNLDMSAFDVTFWLGDLVQTADTKFIDLDK
jgi:hypothetical protein